METSHRKTHPALYTLILVFFFWGFVAASNTVLIGLFRKNFELTQFQSQLVDMAFYSAYFLGSLVYFFISLTMGDPLNKIGHKKGLIIGLCISALGALGFIPAADLHSFPLMLGSLFVVGLGFALQQIVANPFVIAMGDPATGAHRVSLAGGINSFGTTIGPLLINYAIFGSISESSSLGIENVKTPYLILCAAFLVFALILWISKMPEVKNSEKMEGDLGVFKHPQIIWGMLAILIYVGTEVTIQSNLPTLMETKAFLGLTDKQTVHYISLYWGSLMIGRWTGAISVFNLPKKVKQLLMVLVPLIAFGVIYGVNYIKFSSAHSSVEMDKLKDLLGYIPMVFVFILANFLAMEKPVRTMIIFGSAAALLTGYGMLFTGQWALYALVSGGLFCSVMWPCIFSLSIAGLGKYTNQGSSLLVMMILGGAIIPPLQGILSDHFTIHSSYIVPFVGFAFLAFYGWKVGQILKNKGINFDASTGNAH